MTDSGERPQNHQIWRDPFALSAAALSVWAKSPNLDGRWLPLWQHMDDASDIAGALFDDWLSPKIRAELARDFDGDSAAVRVAVRFLAAIHDLGKCTPAFAFQAQLLAQRMRENGLYMPQRVMDKELGHHTVTGHNLLTRWLVSTHGFTKPAARTWGVVLGGHHGAPPDSQGEGVTPVTHPDLYGEALWSDVRAELLARTAGRTGAVDHLSRWSRSALTQQFQVLVTGLVIVADWIASNEELCPYHSGSLPPVTSGVERGERALRLLSLPSPWSPPAEIPDAYDLVRARFMLPEGADARPIQLETIKAAHGMSSPGLIVVEAPMGEGKTEAALAAAEVLARRWGCGGVFVALPTQATTDAMFARVLDWLDRMPGPGDRQVASTMTLSHGKARLNRTFDGLVREAQFRGLRGIGVDEPSPSRRSGQSVTAHAWLTGRKKAHLADFVVGTIDQLLFSALKSRHLMLRHLGLSGKVVIIDEVHAYDVFMSSYLARALTWLGAYGVPVVMLSATLPAGRRHALIEAYGAGMGTRDGATPNIGVPEDNSQPLQYPLVTVTDTAGTRSLPVVTSGRETAVQLHLLDDDDEELGALLLDLLSGGGTALVVRNVVRRALATAAHLATVFPASDITLAHARFIASDRLAKDEWLLDSFGPPSRLAATGTERPQRHVLVATQVVEQSLDIDFDVLITDLAPVDLVLQRMGRLHRHQRGEGQADRPSALRFARCYLTGADWTTAPPEPEPGSARVYHKHPLYRSAAALQPMVGGVVRLPEDIAPLVEAAYGDQVVASPDWLPAMTEAHQRWGDQSDKREHRAQIFQIQPPAGTAPIIGWLATSMGEADDDAQGQGQVRDGAPSLEVLVVEEDENGEWWTPRWVPEYGDLRVPRHTAPDLAVARAMTACSLRLPLDFSNEASERELWAGTPGPWEESPIIYRLPVLVLHAGGHAQISGRTVHYSRTHGLEVMSDEQ